MVHRRFERPATRRSCGGCGGVAPLLLLLLSLLCHRTPVASAQRPLNANATLFGAGAASSTALTPQLRAYSNTFSAGAGANGVSSGEPDQPYPSAGNATGGLLAAGLGPTNRKLSSRQQSMNALDGARPSHNGAQTNGDANGGGGGGGGGGGVAYGAINGGGAGGGISALQQLARQRKQPTAYGVAAASTSGSFGNGNNGNGGGNGGGGGVGGLRKLYALQQRDKQQQQQKQQPPPRPRDESQYTTTSQEPGQGGANKNPLHVLKEKFRNDVSVIVSCVIVFRVYVNEKVAI